ncbi:brachyurin-like [Neocloeon triangulifer]|uniref:brachyurin-like n=1 Tax=Neocloeon triangulifer TaxID=2078957 RepID=UPI00286F7B75|nr:brachyurin-like [Neocloeon triangulifer]
MKVLITCLFLIAAAQATEWSNIRPVIKTSPAIRHIIPGKIIGGGIATLGQLPYQAGVIIDSVGFCGGSLISETVVLTAASCIRGFSSWEVVLGAQNITDSSEPTRQTFTTSDAVTHELYLPQIIKNDIGIINLGGTAGGPGISPVRLPARSQETEQFIGAKARVSGWGITSDTEQFGSPDLRFVEVAVISSDDCFGYYGNIISEFTLCTDTSVGTMGFCDGDTGGPLVTTESDGVDTLIGIVSFRSPVGCEVNAPHGFTRVTGYFKWIEDHTTIIIRP